MEILTAFLLSCVLLVLGAGAAALLLFPVSGTGMTVCWRLYGDCPELEHRIRAWNWLCRCGLTGARLVLLDGGMTEDARRRAALLTDAPLVRETETERLIELVRGEDGAGT